MVSSLAMQAKEQPKSGKKKKKKYKGSASNKLDSNLNSMHLGMRHGSSAIEHDTLCSKYLYATTSSLNQGN